MDKINCFVCSEAMQNSTLYRNHLKAMHENVIITNDFICINCDITRKFSNNNSFWKHVKNHFRSKPNFMLPQNVVQTNTQNGAEDIIDELDEPDDIEMVDENQVQVDPRVDPNDDNGILLYNDFLREQTIKFLGKLNENYAFPRNLIDTIINETTSFLSGGTIQQIKEYINSKLGENGIDGNSVNSILQMLDSLEDPFDEFSTEYKRLKFFKEQGTFIDPTVYYIGNRIETVVVNCQSILKPVEVFAMCIPMRQTLKLFFQIDGMLEKTLSYIEKLKNEPDDYISNIINSVYWKTKLERLNFRTNQLVFPIIFFNDDFEPNNPLGSHAGVHKLGGSYFSVAVLPPELKSKLENIFLAGFYYSSDKKNFSSNESVFKPFVEEINYLTVNGVDIDVNGRTFKIYFVLALIVGDNLGVNSMLGFSEGFMASHFCRFCLVHKDECQHQSEESLTELRKIEEYELDCASTFQDSGIDAHSSFNQIIGFHVYDNPSVDYMHDILEGIVQYELALILNYFIVDKKYFTLEVLNDRINNFNYSAFSSSVNKPPSISLTNLKSHKLKTSAAESKTFMIFLGVMIGDLVKHDDSAWKLYIKLREILFLITCQTVCSESNNRLRSLIKSHHELYLDLFNETLKPKHHFLVHYPGIMEKVGPIVNNSVFRFEAKHRQFKMASNATTCRINLCKTLAIKNQLNFSHRIFQNSASGLPNKYGMYKRIHDDDCLAFLDNEGIENIYLYCEYANFNGIYYKPNMVLWYSVDENSHDPIFLKICKILIQNNEPVFFCHILSINYFDNHKQCFNVNIENSLKLVELKNCATVFPHYFGLICGEQIVILLK